MWQGQVQGNKIWSIAPVPECDHICHKFQYYVEAGDVGKAWSQNIVFDMHLQRETTEFMK